MHDNVAMIDVVVAVVIAMAAAWLALLVTPRHRSPRRGDAGRGPEDPPGHPPAGAPSGPRPTTTPVGSSHVVAGRRVPGSADRSGARLHSRARLHAMTRHRRARAKGTNSSVGFVQPEVDKRFTIMLLVVMASVSLAACDSSRPTPVAAVGSPTTTIAPPSAPHTGAPTTVPTIAPSTTTTTTVPVSVPADGPGVSGRVTAGPTCPVERPDHPCPPNPVRGRVEAVDSGGRTAGSVNTDDTGRYAIGLAPGGYRLRVVTDGPFPRCPAAVVIVTAGSVAVADIVCDTGIR